jgi:CheY-like chemotaxis protein
VTTDSKRLVLAVDDDPALREFYADFLSEDGFSVIVAENGSEALELLDREPDLVLLDLQMPVMNGQKFLEELDRRPGRESLPVVVVSSGAFYVPIAARRALAVLPKPFHFEVLRQMVRALAGPVRNN